MTVLTLTTAFTTASSYSGGSQGWSNTANALADNTSNATATGLTSGNHTAYLYLRGIDGEIPDGSTIVGVEIAIRRLASNARGLDHTIQLALDSAAIGDNQTSTSNAWPESLTTTTFGASNSTWGVAELTDTDVNSNDFGVFIAGTGNHQSQTVDLSVQYVEVTIHYEEPPGITIEAVASTAYLSNTSGEICYPGIESVVSGFLTAEERIHQSYKMPWQDMPNALSDVSASICAYTSLSTETNRSSHVFIVKDLENKVPEGVTITGIEVTYVAAGDGNVGTECESFTFYIGNDYGGTIESYFDWPTQTEITTESYLRWGGVYDTLGETLTPEIVNNEGFGFSVRMRQKTINEGDWSEPRVVYVEVEVFYEAASVEEINFTPAQTLYQSQISGEISTATDITFTPASTYYLSPATGETLQTIEVSFSPATTFYNARGNVALVVPANLVVQALYRCIITGDADGLDDVAVPMDRFQARLRSGRPSYLEVVVPENNAGEYLPAIEARTNGQAVIQRGSKYASGVINYQELVRANLEQPRYAKTSASNLITVTGRRTTTYSNPAVVSLAGVSVESTQDDGSMRVQCAVDYAVRPADTVTWAGRSMVAGLVSFAVGRRTATMYIAEA